MGIHVQYLVPIEPDGSDQTAVIQALIDSLPDGTPDYPSVIQFLPGRYHTEGDFANNPLGARGVLSLTGRHDIVIEGSSPENPTVFYTEAPATAWFSGDPTAAAMSQRRHFWFNRCANITIRNIRVEGSNYTPGATLAPGVPAFWLGGRDGSSSGLYPGYRTQWEFEHGFDFTGCTNVVMDGCQVDAVWGDGVAILSKGVIVSNCFFNRTGRQGITLANARNVLVDGCVVKLGRRSAVDLEPYKDDGYVTDVEIRNSDFTCLGTNYAALGRGDVSRINIHDNQFHAGGASIVCGDSAGKKRRSDWTYRDNIRTFGFGSSQAPLRFTMVDNVTIDGNRLRVSEGSTYSHKCVAFTDCGGSLVVTDNDFTPGGCHITSVNGAAVVSSGNIFGATCL